MNYQIFSNLQFRPLLKNSFHSIHIDLRDTSSEKIFFVSVGITRLILMFRKALAKIIGRTAIPILRKNIVPAAKRVGADLLEIAVPEIAEVVSGRKNIKTAAKVWEDRL